MTDQELVQLIDKAVDDFEGHSGDLESAIGMLMVGRHYGWRIVMLIHSRSTIKKYEKILLIEDIRKYLPETGVLTHRSVAWNLLKGAKNFWKAVRGELSGIKSTMFKRIID